MAPLAHLVTPMIVFFKIFLISVSTSISTKRGHIYIKGAPFNGAPFNGAPQMLEGEVTVIIDV